MFYYSGWFFSFCLYFCDKEFVCLGIWVCSLLVSFFVEVLFFVVVIIGVFVLIVLLIREGSAFVFFFCWFSISLVFLLVFRYSYVFCNWGFIIVSVFLSVIDCEILDICFFFYSRGCLGVMVCVKVLGFLYEKVCFLCWVCIFDIFLMVVLVIISCYGF